MRTNSLLDRDSKHILQIELEQLKRLKDRPKTEATEEQKTANMAENISRMDEYADCSARVNLLSSIVAQLEAYGNKQTLFGITVTANVRNSWILSLVLLGCC